MENLTNLNQSIQTLRAIRVTLANGSSVVWDKVNNAINHLELQVKAALAE